MSTPCEGLLVKVCSGRESRPIYECPSGEWIGNEVLLYDSEGQMIPHTSTLYPVEDSGFVGNGSGYIASYFTDKDGKAIAQANEPVDGEWSPDPLCGNTASDPIYLCYIGADGSSTPGYMICDPGTGGGGSGMVTCTPTVLHNGGTGPGDGSYYGQGNAGSSIAGVTQFYKLSANNTPLFDALLATGYAQLSITIDGTETRFLASDIIPPSDPSNSTGVYLVRPTGADPCGWRLLPGVDINSTSSIVYGGNNAGVVSSGSNDSGTDCTYYDIDGNEVNPDDYESIDSNCDKFDYEPIGTRCVKNSTTGDLLAEVSITYVWDIENSSTTPYAISYVVVDTGLPFTFDPLTMMLGSCSEAAPNMVYGCLTQYDADGNLVGQTEVYQASPLLPSGLYDIANAVYQDADDGTVINKGANDVFSEGKCGVRCYTCAASSASNQACLVGTGTSSVGRVKFDVNPSSLSQATLAGSTINIQGSGSCAGTFGGSYPVTGNLTITQAPNGDPQVQNFIDAFNAIGGNFTAVGGGLDGEETNSMMCVTVPTGLGNIQIQVVTPGGSVWTQTWDDTAGSWSVDDDLGNLNLTGSAANC